MALTRAGGAPATHQGKQGMAGTLIERAWTWLHATFPERQIYIRSHGRVQFFTFGSTLQATCAGHETAGDGVEDASLSAASVPAASLGAIPSTAPSTGSFFGSGASQLNVMPQPVEPQPTTSRPAKASLLDGGLLQFAAALFEP